MNLKENFTKNGVNGVSLSPDAQELLQRAEELGINPDSLTHTRRWNDAGRKWTYDQGEAWDDDSIQHLREFVCNYQMLLEMEVMNVQKEQNSVALRIMFLEQDESERATIIRIGKETAPNLPNGHTETLSRLLEQWEKLDLRIRLLKHRERLISPAYFLCNTFSDDLPENDPVLMALRGLSMETAGYGAHLNRRGKEVAA